MDWLLRLVRVAGASFPVAASLVQLQSEISSEALTARVRKLEDPVSSLHADVPELSRRLYASLKAEDHTRLEFGDDFYRKYRRPLAILDSQGYIEILNALGKQHPVAVRLNDPSYIMYLCVENESDSNMARLVEIVETCPIGHWLQGEEVKREVGLPLSVIKACFAIYEAKGYGICSRSLGAVEYLGQA